MAIKINNAFEKLNPKFYDVWISDKPNLILKGGRSSTKSSVISQKLVEKKMRYPMGNAVILRQVANTLRKSVYSQITWALHDAGVANQFIFKGNPMEIVHKEWGTGFHFSGADDPEKLKSFKIPLGYVQDLWFEEMNSFSGKKSIDTIQDTFIRETLPDNRQMQTWYSWNPERNHYHWSNEFVKKHKNDDSFIINHSTYLDDIRGYNSKQSLEKIERYKTNDIEYWRWMYAGEVIGMGDNVYNADLIRPVNELPSDEYIIYLTYSTDSGHQVSATVTLCVGYTNKRNVVLLDTDYYSPAGKTNKKAPSQMSTDLNDFVARTSREWGKPVNLELIDSAEGALRNQYYLDYKVRLQPVAKKKKIVMIDHVHDLLAQGRCYYLNTQNNQIFIEEHRKYMWDEKTIHSDDPKVIKTEDHSVDAFQYLCLHMARQWGLRV